MRKLAIGSMHIIGVQYDFSSIYGQVVSKYLSICYLGFQVRKLSLGMLLLVLQDDDSYSQAHIVGHSRFATSNTLSLLQLQK